MSFVKGVTTFSMHTLLTMSRATRLPHEHAGNGRSPVTPRLIDHVSGRIRAAPHRVRGHSTTKAANAVCEHFAPLRMTPVLPCSWAQNELVTSYVTGSQFDRSFGFP